MTPDPLCHPESPASCHLSTTWWHLHVTCCDPSLTWDTPSPHLCTTHDLPSHTSVPMAMSPCCPSPGPMSLSLVPGPQALYSCPCAPLHCACVPIPKARPCFIFPCPHPVPHRQHLCPYPCAYFPKIYATCLCCPPIVTISLLPLPHPQTNPPPLHLPPLAPHALHAHDCTCRHPWNPSSTVPLSPSSPPRLSVCSCSPCSSPETSPTTWGAQGPLWVPWGATRGATMAPRDHQSGCPP